MKPSKVMTNIDEIQASLYEYRQRGTRARQLISDIVLDLANMPTKYAEVIAAVAVPGFATSDSTKAQKSSVGELVEEIEGLDTAAKAVQAFLAGITEF